LLAVLLIFAFALLFSSAASPYHGGSDGAMI